MIPENLIALMEAFSDADFAFVIREEDGDHFLSCPGISEYEAKMTKKIVEVEDGQATGLSVTQFASASASASALRFMMSAAGVSPLVKLEWDGDEQAILFPLVTDEWLVTRAVLMPSLPKEGTAEMAASDLIQAFKAFRVMKGGMFS